MNKVLVAMILLGLCGLMTGCGSTWDGLKRDTSINLEKSGNAISQAGRSLKSE